MAMATLVATEAISNKAADISGRPFGHDDRPL